MAFEFRLKTLLEYRQHLLKNVQISLVNAQQQHQALCAERQQLLQLIEQQKKIWLEQQAQGIQVAQHLLCAGYLKSLEQNLLSLEKRIARASSEVAAIRETLLQRETEVQMLESLKTTAHEEHRKGELKREQKRLDATAIFADYRKREKVHYE